MIKLKENEKEVSQDGSDKLNGKACNRLVAKWQGYIKDLEKYKSNLLNKAQYISPNYFMENFGWVLNEIHRESDNLKEFKTINKL